MLKVMLIDNEAAIRMDLAHGSRWENLGCTVWPRRRTEKTLWRRFPEFRRIL